MKEAESRRDQERALRAVVSYYLGSHDFNGIPGSRLSTELELSLPRTKKLILKLRNRRLVDVVGPSTFVNPHIRPFTRIPLEAQDQDLQRDPANFCVYPSQDVLLRMVDPIRYYDRPYTLELALGEGQLELRYARSEVLEHYLSHQERYDVRDAIEGGSIRVKDGYYLSVPESERSEIFRGPKRYGRRQLRETGGAVCNILWDLSSFSPPEQAYWRAFELRKARFVPVPEDEHFRVWLDRNLGGQRADSHDPIQQIYQAIARINRALSEDLFALPRDEEDLPRNPDLT